MPAAFGPSTFWVPRWLEVVITLALTASVLALRGHYCISLALSMFVAVHLTVKAWCMCGRGPVPEGASYLRYGGSRLAVYDPDIAKELSRVALHKADQRLTFAFCGGHRDGILSTNGELWERQRRLIHREIARRAPRFIVAARAVVAELSRSPPPDGTIELLHFFGPLVSAISCTALGDEEGGEIRGAPLEAAPSVLTVMTMMSMSLTDNAGLDAWILRAVEYAGAFILRRSAHERQLRHFLSGSSSPFYRALLAEFGLEQTLGHLWTLTLGSTVPETVILCRILRDLSEDEQARPGRAYPLACGHCVDAFTMWRVPVPTPMPMLLHRHRPMCMRCCTRVSTAYPMRSTPRKATNSFARGSPPS